MAAVSYPRTLWILRHAEREDNVNRGWRNTEAARGLERDNAPLSARGKTQASECAIRFSKVPLSHIFASPFDRTVETASAIAAVKKLPVKPEAGLLEALYLCEKPPSFWEVEKLKEKFPLVDTEYLPVFTKHILPKEGFGDDACIPRLRQTIHRITDNYAGDILFVAHGASIASAHDVLVGEFKYVGQATVSKFTEIAPGKFVENFSNDSGHLSDKKNLRPW